MNKPQYLFVYGTLRRNRQNHIQHPFLETCTYINDALMHGELYEVDTYPGAVADGAARVKGELYLMQNPEQTLSAVDIYEECTAQFPDPHEYMRSELVVILPDGQTISAWTYLYNRPLTGLKRIDCGDYLNYLQDKS